MELIGSALVVAWVGWVAWLYIQALT